MNRTNVYKLLSGLDKMKWSVVFKGILSGLVAGFLVVFYRIGIEFGTESAIKIYSFLKIHPIAIFLWIGVIVLVGLLISSLIKIEPMASGSGIPQVEGIVLYGLKIKWYTILFVRYIAGIGASFFGVSLGREGPSIQIGAAGSQALVKKIARNKLEENYLITGGAAAGLSAAFNAPLAGIVFTLEEVHRSFSPLILIAATTASLTADLISKYFFGLKPVLYFQELPQLPEHYYFWLLPLGVISGLIGSLINKSLLGIQVFYKKIPTVIQPMMALIIALPIGLLLPSVLGGGQNLIQIAESAKFALTSVIILLIVKFVFTCTSFGSGIPGGIFMPILSMGALAGSLFGIVATHFGLPTSYIADFAICGMAGTLSGSVKAPVTSILLMAEMTGSFVHLLPVAACAFIALLLSDILKVTPIYETLLERTLKKDGHMLEEGNPGGIIEIAVELGSQAAGKKVRDVNWPEGLLVVGIRRGEKEIVPNGNVKILPGDYLVVLSSQYRYDEIGKLVREICYTK